MTEPRYEVEWSDEWTERHRELRRTMPGFDGLIVAAQGLLVGVSLATAEIWVTPDVATTREIAFTYCQDIAKMTLAWGVEQ